MVLVGQLALASLTERKRTAVRHDALEAATNILESAQAGLWDALTPDWAAAQRLPDDLTLRMHEPRLTVRVEPDASRRYTKKVTVEIAWQLDEGVLAAPIVLSGWFSARTASQKGAP